MSLGFTGRAKIVSEDADFVIYAYSGENWDDINSRPGDIDLLDGRIVIRKCCLQENDYDKHIEHGDVRIEKRCKNELIRLPSVYPHPYIAHILIYKIFSVYQKRGKIPKRVAFIQ